MHKSVGMYTLFGVVTVFRGEKAQIFWWGLMIFCLAIVELFAVFCYPLVVFLLTATSTGLFWASHFADAVFLLIGFCKMSSSVKKEEIKS